MGQRTGQRGANGSGRGRVIRRGDALLGLGLLPSSALFGFGLLRGSPLLGFGRFHGFAKFRRVVVDVS
jgi:hypothetical protein